MRLKLTLFCLAIGYIVIAQKQIQPYTFTQEDKTILIYASAKSANNITFSLKNDKNLSFKNKEGENISFDVSPFIETIFKSKLKEAIIAINSYEGKEDDEVISENEIVNLEDYEKETRNIYQFFNALIITAFQYDTEPVAGTLKYALDVNITKISGSTDFYKLARCIDNKKKSDLDTANFKNPDFVNYIKNNKFEELKKFERHEIRKILKKEYNAYKMDQLLEGDDIFKNYITYKKDLKAKKILIEDTEIIKNDLRKKIDLDKNSIQNKILELDYQVINLESDSNQLETEIEEQKKLKQRVENIKNTFKEQLTDSTLDSILSLNDLTNNLISNELLKSKELTLKKKKREVTEKINESNKLKTKLKDLEKEYSLKVKETTKKIEKEKRDLEIKIDQYIVNKRKQILDIPLYEFKIDDIQLDINNGFIEHITITGKVKKALIPEDLVWKNYAKPGTNPDLSFQQVKEYMNKFYNEPLVKQISDITNKELKFVNAFPLGFSSRTDFDDLHNYELTYYEGREAIFSIPVTDVIKMYIQKHQNDRLDFSPKNQTISLPQDDLNKEFSLELKKEKSSKILGARFFSDFIGFNQADPNGLIQVEIEKLIPLWTRRYLIRGSRGRNVGWVNYVKPSFNWARIEDREEELTLSNNTISYLDLIRYKNTSIGFDLNAFTFDVPNSKLRFELNGGVHYGRTRVINTSTQFNKNVGYFNLYPEAKVRIRPEERFGGALIYRPNKILIPKGTDFNGFSTVQNDGQWLHGIELSTFYTPNINSDNKFFFRYRYTNTANQETNGFSQFQVGYLAYLKF
ncbi:coiled-coil domain-containing protein [Tenacibaculum sp. ZS6-P6]|uniref:coiled-coil domain-containing protein n=1 Tax=Tenacibaculum sp. ZS6-P6 TaxID=3447503 RepID=UPI003F97C344